MSSLIRVDSLQVHNMADNVVLVTDSVSSQHIATISSNGQSLATVIPLQNTNHLWDKLTLLLESAKLKTRVETQTDLCHCISELLLDQLISSQGSTKLFPAHGVVSCLLNTELCCSQTTPGDTISSIVETRVETQTDLCHCISKLLLDQLISSQRSTKLFPAHGVVSCLLNTELCCSQTTPGDTISSIV